MQQRRPIFLFKITDVFIKTQKRGRVNEILDYYTDIVFLSVPQLKRFVNNKKWATNNVKIEYGLSFDIKYLGFKIEASSTASGVPLRIPFGQCFSTWFISDRVNKVSL